MAGVKEENYDEIRCASGEMRREMKGRQLTDMSGQSAVGTGHSRSCIVCKADLSRSRASALVSGSETEARRPGV